MTSSAMDPTTLAAWIALGGVLISAAVAYVTASRSVYVNAVTAARIVWLDRIRDLVVEFREDYLKIIMDKRGGHKISDELVFRANRNFETLSLSLGKSKNEIHVLSLIAHCLSSYTNYDEAIDYSQKLQMHTRWLLETEWKRIKIEAGSLLLRPIYKWRMFNRDTAYLRFAEREGLYVDRNISRESLFKLTSSPSPASAARP